MKIIKLLTSAVCMLMALSVSAAAVQDTARLQKMNTYTEPNPEALAQPGPVVDLHTTMGDIRIKLFDDTPQHRDNFLKLVREGAYDSVMFHRVIKDFMVQTGDPTSRHATKGQHLGAGDPGYTIPAEIVYPKHYHKYGALAAARTPDQMNPEKRSSGSQFYIVTGKKYDAPTISQLAERMQGKALQKYFQDLVIQRRDTIEALQKSGDKAALEALRNELIKETEANVGPVSIPENIKKDYELIGGTPFLDGDYTVFGSVISGMDTVEKIQNAATDSNDRPVEDIRILSAVIEGEPAESPAKAVIAPKKKPAKTHAAKKQVRKTAKKR